MKNALAGALALAFMVSPASAAPAPDNPLAALFRALTGQQVAILHPPGRVGYYVTHPRGARFWCMTSAEHPPLVSVASRYVGSRNWTGVRRWCAAGLRTFLTRAGYPALQSNRAVDYARYGRSSAIVPGAILVWRHHVGVYAGDGATISANGRGGRVHIGPRSLRGLIAVRAPA